ncbi:hypothetical protein Trydic_g21231 [Trypoxylus dichotomus]
MDSGPPIVVSPRRVVEVMKGIPQRKSPGEDRIPNGALKNLLLKLLVNLATIFNAVFRLTCYPSGQKKKKLRSPGLKEDIQKPLAGSSKEGTGGKWAEEVQLTNDKAYDRLQNQSVQKRISEMSKRRPSGIGAIL